MRDLPTGTVTFLFTDIEGSTRLWQEHPDAMRHALARHAVLAERHLHAHSGTLVRERGEGDSLFAVFARAGDALAGASALQAAFHAEAWPGGTPLRVRMALHTGEADLREGDYYGSAVNRCARLRALAHGGQALLSQTTCDLVCDALPPGVSLRDMGTHRLRDLARPERVFQILGHGLPAEFPPLVSLDALPNNLPAQTTSFVGRTQESAEVKARLGTGRLLSITGPGGVGKTRLALQVAADLAADSGDGVWFVELAALSDPALVPQAAAFALRVREEPGRTLSATLLDFLQPKTLLLVVDNCEHLLPACARLADQVLRTCPGVTLLTTSRSPLGVAGEAVFPVPSLSLPGLDDLPPPDRLAQYSAVRLFLDRVEAGVPAFQVTEANASAVARICHRLDGIPLAIELAAARVRVLPVEQIAARLDDRFRLLTGGSPAALPRQQTLRALVDWSHALLTSPQKTLFARLSVFPDGWSLDAAEAVCAGTGLEASEILDALGALVDQSLVSYDGAQSTDSEPCYRLLETIRQYAGERLTESGEGEAVRGRHAAHALGLVEDLERAARAEGCRHDDWYACMAQEQQNVRAALAWCRSAGAAGAEAGVRLAGASFWFWYYSGRFTEGRNRLEAALTEGAEATPGARAKALAGAGCMALMLNDYAAARTHLTASVALCRESGDGLSLGLALFLLGMMHTYAGDVPAGESLAREALALARRHGSRVIVGYCLVLLGLHAFLAGDDSEAEALFGESLTLARTLGNRPHLGTVLARWGDLRQRQGRQGEARAAYAEGIGCSQNGEGVLSLARCLHGMAGLWAARGDALRTARLLATVDVLFERVGATMPPFEAIAYARNVATARAALGADAFDAAQGEGRAMTGQQAALCALGESPSDVRRSDDPSCRP